MWLARNWEKEPTSRILSLTWFLRPGPLLFVQAPRVHPRGMPGSSIKQLGRPRSIHHVVVVMITSGRWPLELILPWVVVSGGEIAKVVARLVAMSRVWLED